MDKFKEKFNAKFEEEFDKEYENQYDTLLKECLKDKLKEKLEKEVEDKLFEKLNEKPKVNVFSWKWFKSNLYIFLLVIAGVLLVVYTLYWLDLLNVKSDNIVPVKLIEIFGHISLYFFTAGIFSASVKYMQFMGVFQSEFEKVIMSRTFDKKLEEHITNITFSEDFLSKQGNLDEIWRTVTLCKYKSRFPELSPKLDKQLDNSFFKSDNVYYYKNFQLCYEIEKHSAKTIKILEKASYTIVRPNLTKFNWNCRLSYYKNDQLNTSSDFKCILIDSNENILGEVAPEVPLKQPNYFLKEVNYTLEGHIEYYIERKIEIIQDIEKDKEYSFSSDKIIDDLSVLVKPSDDVCVHFLSVNRNKFYDNIASNTGDISKINRGLFLAGEKFKLFIDLKK